MNKNVRTIISLGFIFLFAGSASAVPIKWTLDGTLYNSGLERESSAYGSFIFDNETSTFSNIALRTPLTSFQEFDSPNDESSTLEFTENGNSSARVDKFLKLSGITIADLAAPPSALLLTLEPGAVARYDVWITTGAVSVKEIWAPDSDSVLTGEILNPTVSVPEPATLALLALGLAGLGITRRRTNTKRNSISSLIDNPIQ